MGREGEGESGRKGESVMGRKGEWVKERKGEYFNLFFSLSPAHPITLSPLLSITLVADKMG